MVEKPSGVATAHAPAGQESVFRWLQETWLTSRRARGGAAGAPSGVPFVGVVSRLDQPVSGIVVFAKTPAAAAALADQFRRRTVVKTYVALIEGRFPGRVGDWCRWQDRLPRLPARADRSSAPGDDGDQDAATSARLLERSTEVSLVELRPSTGRKHQLRRQLADRRCPIVGDRRYGSRLPLASGGIALHATELRFLHPGDGKPMQIRSQPPRLWFDRFPAFQAPRIGD